MRILKSIKETGTAEEFISGTNSSSYVKIASIKPIVVTTKKGEQLLVTFTVPDTWCSKAGQGAWFAIKADGKEIARGLYTCGLDGQRVPISLQALIDMESDMKKEISVWWHGTGGGTCYIGSISETVLTVLVNDDNSLAEKMMEIVKSGLKFPGGKTI